MNRILFCLIVTIVISFNEMNAHDISLGACFSQSVTKQNSFRLSMVRGSQEIYRFEMASTNLIEDNSIKGKYYISTNTISLLLNCVAMKTDWGDILTYAMIPLLIGNMKFSIDVYPKYFQVIVGQTTDYYLHYKISRIFTASSVGIESHISDFRLVAELLIPLSKGYRIDKKPYIQLSVGYYF